MEQLLSDLCSHYIGEADQLDHVQNSEYLKFEKLSETCFTAELVVKISTYNMFGRHTFLFIELTSLVFHLLSDFYAVFCF